MPTSNSEVRLANSNDITINPATEDKQDDIITAISGLAPDVEYDEIVLSYTGDNLTSVVYKLASVTIVTLTLSYDGSNRLTGIVKT